MLRKFTSTFLLAAIAGIAGAAEKGNLDVQFVKDLISIPSESR